MKISSSIDYDNFGSIIKNLSSLSPAYEIIGANDVNNLSDLSNYIFSNNIPEFLLNVYSNNKLYMSVNCYYNKFLTRDAYQGCIFVASRVYSVGNTLSDWITSNPSVEYLVCRLSGDGIDCGVNNISSGGQSAINVDSALNLSRTDDVTLSADNQLAQLLFNNFQDQVNINSCFLSGALESAADFTVVPAALQADWGSENYTGRIYFFAHEGYSSNGPMQACLPFEVLYNYNSDTEKNVLTGLKLRPIELVVPISKFRLKEFSDDMSIALDSALFEPELFCRLINSLNDPIDICQVLCFNYRRTSDLLYRAITVSLDTTSGHRLDFYTYGPNKMQTANNMYKFSIYGSGLSFTINDTFEITKL